MVDDTVLMDAMRFSAISVYTNRVALSLQYPTNLVEVGSTIDVLFNLDLRSAVWEWATNRVVDANDIGADGVGRAEFSLSYGVEIPADQSPLLFKASVRETAATTMADGDGDGIPDVYELFHGTNPYVSDYDLAPKTTVGAGGDYPTIRAALAASVRYSIIEDAADLREDSPIHMPLHPVMVTGPTNGYAVVRGRSAPGVFVLSDGQDERTVFRNLYLVLDAETNFQSGFWVGGNLPWSGFGAGGTFRNVRIRMPHRGTEYFGWHFYRYSSVTSEISHCALDASGAQWAYGVYGMDPPPLAIDDCSFLNFGSDGTHDCIGMYLLRSLTGLNPGPLAAVSVRNTLFDDSFARAVPIARIDGDAGVTLLVENCLMPTNSIYGDQPEVLNGLVVTNALVSHFGHPLPESPAVDLGIGAIGVFPMGGLDTDGDGINDYDEVYVYGTDPWLVDTDCDGLPDDDELAHATDPADADSFYRAISYSVAGCDGIDDVTNRVCWSTSPDGWQDANDVREFDLATSSGAYDVMTDTGIVYLKAYRDFNHNGVYDSDVEPMVVRGVGMGVNVAHIDMAFGNVDGDPISDIQEYADGTSPTDGCEYAFYLDLTYTDVFQTTNSLTFSVVFGSSVVYPPTVVTNSTWHYDFGRLAVTTGEHMVVSAWDDANCNELWDDGETGNRYVIYARGHDMVQTNRMSYGNFDLDRNELPDWWERSTGLSEMEGSHSETDDNDHDGLINLHELWAGTNPTVPDGSNTLLSVCSRSIDDRLSSTFCEEHKQRFVNYYENGSNLVFVTNNVFWARDVDLSCASMWNDSETDVWGGACQKWHKAGTAISRKHIICAFHYGIPVGTHVYFMGAISGLVCRRIERSMSVGNDIMLSALDEELPADIVPAKVLPDNFKEYICNGRHLPVATLDQEEKMLVADLYGLSDFENRTTISSALVPNNLLRRPYYEDIVSGDSGSPRFLLVGNEVVLLYTLWRGGTGSGCFVSNFLREIQQTMDSLSPGYSLEIVDLSMYQRLH